MSAIAIEETLPFEICESCFTVAVLAGNMCCSFVLSLHCHMLWYLVAVALALCCDVAVLV